MVYLNVTHVTTLAGPLDEGSAGGCPFRDIGATDARSLRSGAHHPQHNRLPGTC